MFKVGQKVICVNDKNQLKGGLIENKIYTIDEFDEEEDIKVIGLPWYNFKWRFKPLNYDLLDNKSIISEIVGERAEFEVPELVETN